MTRSLMLILVLIVFTAALVFFWENSGTVEIRYVIGTSDVRLYWVLLGALVAGWSIGFALTFSYAWRARQQVRRLRQAARAAETELNNLRNLPIRNEH